MAFQTAFFKLFQPSSAHQRGGCDETIRAFCNCAAGHCGNFFGLQRDGSGTLLWRWWLLGRWGCEFSVWAVWLAGERCSVFLDVPASVLQPARATLLWLEPIRLPAGNNDAGS